MKKSDLKAAIKPLIKECLMEVLVEEGFSKMLGESLQKNTQISVETFPKQPSQSEKPANLLENKKKMLDAIAMGGFDPFVGTKPLTEGGNNVPQVAVTGLPPGDSGVDIRKLLGENKAVWKTTLNALNGKKEK